MKRIPYKAANNIPVITRIMRPTLGKWCHWVQSKKSPPVQVCISLLALLNPRINYNGFVWNNRGKCQCSYSPPAPPMMDFTDCHGAWCSAWKFGCGPDLAHELKSTYPPCSKRKINNFLKALCEYYFSPLPNHSTAWFSLWSSFLIHRMYIDPVHCDQCGPFSLFQMSLSFCFEPHGSRLFLTLGCSVSFGRRRAVWEAHGTKPNRLQIFVSW